MQKEAIAIKTEVRKGDKMDAPHCFTPVYMIRDGFAAKQEEGGDYRATGTMTHDDVFK